MKKLIQKVIAHPFLSGSLMMVVGSNFYNFGQFAYHFLAGRFLGKAQYGDLATIISILGLVTIVQIAFGLTIVKFIASEKNENKVADFIKWVYKWSLIVGGVIAALLFLASPFLSSFLHLSQPLSIYLLSPVLFFFIVTTTGRSVLQGLLRFDKYVVSLVLESIVKIGFMLILATLGYAIFGAMVALFIGIVAAFLVVRSSLSKYLRGRISKIPKIAPLLKYSFFVFLQGLCLTSMYSMDLILVKHFFKPDEAGIYASLAVLGRIVFFGASPITHVMFPIIAKRHQEGERYYKIFYFSLIMVLTISILVLLFYFYFPHLAIGILYGSAFLEGSKFLWWFALFMMLLAVAMLLTQFYLSIGKVKIISLFVVAALLQIILITLFHSTILVVIQLSILTAALLNVALFVYLIYLNLRK